MDQAQKDLQNAGNQLREKITNQANQSIQDAKDIKPEQWGVAFGIALVVSIVLQLITKQKEDPFISFGTFIYAIVVGALSVFLRNTPLGKQFQTMIVLLSVVRCLFEISPVTILIFSALPFIVNFVTAELKNRGILKL
eukprot:UN01456